MCKRKVVRAQNIARFVPGHCEFKCSRCGADAGEIAYGSLDGAKVNYCPNCGAFIGDGTKWDGTFGGDYPYYMDSDKEKGSLGLEIPRKCPSCVHLDCNGVCDIRHCKPPVKLCSDYKKVKRRKAR